MSRTLIIFLFLSTAPLLQAQEPATIRFAREKNQLYFFQTGEKSDTISKGRGDLFFMVIPDTLKNVLRINIDNALMEPGSGDSLYRLLYMPGLRYELIFIDSVKALPGDKNEVFYRLKVRINGAALLPAPVIRIEFVDRRRDRRLLENDFYFRVGD